LIALCWEELEKVQYLELAGTQGLAVQLERQLRGVPNTHQQTVVRSILGVVAADEHSDNVLGHSHPIVDTAASAGNDTDAETLLGGGDIGIGGGQEEEGDRAAPVVSGHLEECYFVSYSHIPSSNQRRHCLETLEAVSLCLKVLQVCSHVAERVVESVRCSSWNQRRSPERRSAY
jgi:hypothetical protein